jgi:hypothetical protein
MLIGSPALFTKDHYEAHKGTAPAELCELVVHCLELVSQLSSRGLDYRFKGGNSLLLLLEDPQRFSIDVDIVTTETKEKLIALVDEIAADCDQFTRAESRAPKTKPWLPMISFKLFFDSAYETEYPYVMLDVVLEPPPYPGVTRRVRCGSIYASDQETEVPSISGLIGDKLLTLGPATLGIPLGKGKEAQRLKHVFDVALLSRQGYDIAAVKSSVVGCMEQENRIQGSEWKWEPVSEDTRAFIAGPLANEVPPELSSLEEGTYFYEIVKGFEGFRQYLFRIDYTWELFRNDCRAVGDVVAAVDGAM